MKAISVRQQDKLRELVLGLDSCVEEVRSAIIAFNDALAGPRQGLESAIKKHNTAAASLKEFLTELAEAADEHLGTRSERWQATDAGAAYVEWAQSLAEAAESIVEIDESDLTVEELSEPELFDPDSWTHPANTPDE